MPVHFALFETAIGVCGIAWSAHGLRAVQLPEASPAGTRERLTRYCPEACAAPPPPGVRRAMDRIAALLSGERGEAADLSAAVLDMDGIAPFHRRVYEAARTVPPGVTVSYGALAERTGAPGAARAVGQALAKNPFALVVPCHRVLGATGKLGGFSAHGGLATKRRLLAIEGAAAGREPVPSKGRKRRRSALHADEALL